LALPSWISADAFSSVPAFSSKTNWICSWSWTTRSASSSSPSRKSLYPCERKSMKILFVSSSSNAPAPPSDSWKGGGGGGGV
jgi:hypothetical protein